MLPMQLDIVDVVLGNPVLFAALAFILYALVTYQRTLTYHEYRILNGARIAVFTAFNPIASRFGRSLVNPKGGVSDPEFVQNVDGTVREVIRMLHGHGFEYHLLATVKRRRVGGKIYTAQAQLRYSEVVDGEQVQTEAYLFETANGVDVYAHVEADVQVPKRHLRGIQHNGDVRGHVVAALHDE